MSDFSDSSLIIGRGVSRMTSYTCTEISLHGSTTGERETLCSRPYLLRLGYDQ